MVAHFAVLRANAVVVPVNPMNRAQELQHHISDPAARFAIVAADSAQERLAANEQLPAEQRLSHLLVTHYSDALDDVGPNPSTHASLRVGCRPVGVTGWPIAMVLLSGLQWRLRVCPPLPIGRLRWRVQASRHRSRWTGRHGCAPIHQRDHRLPKGCVHTHATVMHNAMAASLWGNGTPENAMLAVVPMFHITGMVSGMHACIYGSGCMVIMPRWDRELAGQLISQWKVTHWTNIPTMVMDLLASPNFESFDLSSLVYIGGGAPCLCRCSKAVGSIRVALRGRLRPHGNSRTIPCQLLDRPKQQCLGIPFLNVDARVVDPETFTELPAGEQGEIVVNGPAGFCRLLAAAGSHPGSVF